MLAIKQTLYRTGPQSPVVDALVDAARAGKEVTVIVELLARFDEEANIELATRLQEAGAHVVYGVVGYKTHAKLILVVRRERGKLRRYCHLRHRQLPPRTARVYTDYGLFTATRPSATTCTSCSCSSPASTRVATLQKHPAVAVHAARSAAGEDRARDRAARSEGKPARIIAKMNALIEPQIIQALYAPRWRA